MKGQLKKMLKSIMLATLLSVVAGIGFAEQLRCDHVFGNGMVLQREKPVSVWGFGEPGVRVSLSFAGQVKEAICDVEGRWRTVLAPMPASASPRDLVITQGGMRIVLSDVLIGEVWILAGQSNMQYGLRATDEWFDVRRKVDAGEYRQIRYLQVDQGARERKTCFDLTSAAWRKTTDIKSLEGLSATGFYFARTLQPSLDVPVGLVDIPRGGTRMFQWVDAETVASDGRFSKCNEAAASGKRLCEDWDARVVPLSGLAVRGILWYQGESDSWNPYPSSNFGPMFEELIGCWRRAWGEPELPFIVAQLPSMDAHFWPRTRAAQDAVARKLKGVSLANLIDTGWRHDVHPHDKQWVGPRLADVALKDVYGRTNIMVAPRMEDVSFAPGRAVVTFDMPVTARGSYRRGFELKLGGVWKSAASAKVRADGSVEVVAPNTGARPEGVRYLYEGWAKPDVWLFGLDGTPAFAFTTVFADMDQTLEPFPATLFLAGDSTLDEHDGDESKFASWGASLRSYLKPGVRIVNYAKSGRSTKSFREEGWWNKILSELRAGDFVLIQFGHNDQKLGKPEVAVPQAQFKTNLWQMVREVRARHATPFFATPIVRLTYDGGQLVDKANLDAWAQRMREVASEANVRLIDMRKLTRSVAESVGEREALSWNAPGDRTHPAKKGARLYGELFHKDIKARNLELAHLFNASPVTQGADWLQKRIDTVAAAGGGRVVVPSGRHLTGQIDLRSNVELHLEKGAVLEGKVGIENYRVTELPFSEGTWSAVVSAIGVTNVAITGQGEIFGNGTAWPQPKDYGRNQEGCRPRGVFFANCKNVRLSDFTLRDSACWGVVLKCCEGVDIRRVKVDSHANANNDGIDIEAKDVVIADCDIDAGDDAVCLKSNDPSFVVENVLVSNVIARSHCNVLKLGTASHGTMRNITFVDCRTDVPRRDFVDHRLGRNRRWYEEDPKRVGLYPGAKLGEAAGLSAIAIENVDGGMVENVVYRNIAVRGAYVPIFVRAGTRKGRSCGTPPSDKYVFRNIAVEGVTGEAMSTVASSITGVQGCRIANVSLRNIRIVCRGGGKNEIERTRPVPEVAGRYPDAHMFGCMLPAYGLYVRHVDGLALEGAAFILKAGDVDRREPIVLDDVSDVSRLSPEEFARKSWLADWDRNPKHARLPRPKEWYEIRSDIGYEQVNLEDGSRVFRRKRPFRGWLPADCTTMAPSDGPSELRFSDPVPQAKPIKTESVVADFHAVDRGGFTIRLRVDMSDVRRNERLYAIPNGVQVYLRLAERKVKGKRQHPACTYDSGAGNYVNFPMSDGTMPVIEALFSAPAGRVGIPLGLLERPSGEHEVVINLSHAHVSIVVDGKYVDEDLPFCAPGWPKGPAVAETYSPRVKASDFSCPAVKDAVPRIAVDRPLSRPVQYWTPDGHNAWVGDVVTGWHDGRYHVFYLYDRRHHYGKAGKGGHFFAHLSTKDMSHWTEHPYAVPIVHRWEAQGTGTPFVYQGQYCLAYGYHTERMPNNEGLPIGATYAVSDDGINFRRTEKIIGEGRNPTIFNRADGMLGLINSYLCTPGLYESDHPGDWKMIDADLPLNGDCPCLFDWNGRYYLLQGFSGFASSPNGKPGTFENWNKTGDDIYEGLSVPMVSPFSGNRRIMAGWLSGVRCEWGGWLVLRELVAYSDGRLGTKWVPECVPDVPVIEAAKGRMPIRESRAIYMFENLSPQAGLQIDLMPEKSGEKRLSLTIDPTLGHAQFNVSEAGAELPYVKTMYEHMLDNPSEMKKKNPSCWGRKGRPDRGGDFAIGKIRGLDRPWGLRLAVWYDKKADATIVDAELAGQRTMITRHPGRFTELVSHEGRTEPPQLRKVVVNGAPFPLTVCEWTPPAKDFKITDYGAKRDGRPVTESIERAVSAAARAGGGRVIVPKGEWLTGAFKLKSDVALVLDKDAELHFPDDPVVVYRAPLDSDGRPQPTQRGLIEAEGCTNVAVMGEGTLKADVDYWHRNFSQNAQRGFPRPDFFFFSRCRNVRFDGFRVRGSPSWTMHFLLCEDILLRRVDSVCTGCNTDGLDLESCNRALVEGCSLDQGDDAYTIKSGLNEEGRRRNVPTQNVVIRNCRAVRAHALLGIGSEVSGGIRNIYMADCTVDGECLNWLFVKTNPKRGAFVENVTMERVRGRKAKEAVFRVLTQYDGNPRKELVNRDFAPLLTRISGVSVRDVVCLDAKDAVRIEGDARMPPTGLSAENICVGRLARDLVRVSAAPDFFHKGIRVDLRAASNALGLSE